MERELVLHCRQWRRQNLRSPQPCYQPAPPPADTLCETGLGVTMKTTSKQNLWSALFFHNIDCCKQQQVSDFFFPKQHNNTPCAWKGQWFLFSQTTLHVFFSKNLRIGSWTCGWHPDQDHDQEGSATPWLELWTRTWQMHGLIWYF